MEALHRSSLGSQQSHHHVELSGNNIGDDGAEYIAQKLLPKHRYLKALYLDDNKIGNDGAEQIGEGLPHNKYLETSVLVRTSFTRMGP